MSAVRTMGVSVTDVHTTQQLPLGFEFNQPADTTNEYGDRTWVYVHNDPAAAAAWALGEVIIRDPSTITQDWFGGEKAPVTVHTPQVMCLGVAQHAIAAGSYGFILKKGIGTVLAGSAGVALDQAFTTGGSAAGTVLIFADDTAMANISVIGHTATAIGGGASGTAYINCG
mgnify:CR=1 FL=1